MKLKAEKKANIVPICILFVTGIVIVFFCVKAALENITRDGAGFFLFAGIGAFFVFICIMHFITEYKNIESNANVVCDIFMRRFNIDWKA